MKKLAFVLAALAVAVVVANFRFERVPLSPGVPDGTEVRSDAPGRPASRAESRRFNRAPQAPFAFGFSKTKPDCISESFQSSVMPSRNTRLFGSMKTLTSSNCMTLSVARGLVSNLN